MVYFYIMDKQLLEHTVHSFGRILLPFNLQLSLFKEHGPYIRMMLKLSNFITVIYQIQIKDVKLESVTFESCTASLKRQCQ